MGKLLSELSLGELRTEFMKAGLQGDFSEGLAIVRLVVYLINSGLDPYTHQFDSVSVLGMVVDRFDQEVHDDNDLSRSVPGVTELCESTDGITEATGVDETSIDDGTLGCVETKESTGIEDEPSDADINFTEKADVVYVIGITDEPSDAVMHLNGKVTLVYVILNTSLGCLSSPPSRCSRPSQRTCCVCDLMSKKKEKVHAPQPRNTLEIVTICGIKCGDSFS